MKKYYFLTLALCFLGFGKGKAQTQTPGEKLESILSNWNSTLEDARLQAGVSADEFAVFKRFYAHSIDSVHLEFIRKINSHSIDIANVSNYMESKKPFFAALFNTFRKTELEFPTSVSEYKTEHRPRIGQDTCFPICYNTGFEDGTFDGWYGYYGVNSSSNIAFNITSITGGYMGPVSRGAQDPFTNNDYQLHITSGSATDNFLSTYSTYSMPQVSPWGGSHSVMMGDTTWASYGTAILSQTFLVTSNHANLTLEYALFLENPVAHAYYQQPFFSVVVIDATTGDTIPGCGKYLISADFANQDGFKGIWYPVDADSVYWKPWTLENVPLQNYIGHCVTVIFSIQDCALGGHFGYAYVDASCSPVPIATSSPVICGSDSVSLTAPPFGSKFIWTGPTNGILSNDTLQTVWVDSGGTYTVVCIPSTGPACADTLTITVGRVTNATLTASASPNTIPPGDSTALSAICNVTATYSWAPAASVTHPDSANTEATPAVTTTYTVTATTPCGIYTATVTVNVSPCNNNYNEPICMVSVDTMSGKVDMFWGRTNSPPTTGFYSIYKDSTAGYEITHRQQLLAFSEFVDLNSFPLSGPVSYKLSTNDSCGESSLSAPHTTIYLTTTAALNVYILNWTAYVGFTPTWYRILRGVSVNSVIQIDSVPSNTLTYHDTLPPPGCFYFIQAVNPNGPCIPTTEIRRHNISSVSYSGSFSNGFNTNNITTGSPYSKNTISNLNIYPNPSNGMFTIEWSVVSGQSPVRISIYDGLGQVVYDNITTQTIGNNKEQINLESLATGIYTLRMQTSGGSMVRKVVIMHKN